MKIISFWQDTDDSRYYEKSAARLETQLQNYGFEYVIEHRPDAGDNYLDITKFKPTFIKEKLRQLKEPVVYIDADCTIRTFFKIISDVDVPRYLVNEQTLYGNALYFPPKPVSTRILNAWIKQCSDWPGGDHSALAAIFPKFKAEMKPFGSSSFVLNGNSRTQSKLAAEAALKAAGWDKSNPLAVSRAAKTVN